MRFKNLTITITLGCLSLVALAGLVMLPISDGICWEDNNFGNSKYKSLTNSKEIDVTGRGWNLSASLAATSHRASASATPSITGLNDFTETHAWIGHVNAYAQANACTVFRLKWWSNVYYKKVNIEAKSFESSGDLRAKVVVGLRAWGEGEVKIKSDPDVKFSLTAPLDEFIGIGSEINFSGNIYVQLDDAEFIYNVDSPVDISEVQIAEVSSVWEAYKSASIKSFWFGTQSIDNGEQVADESDRRTFNDADVYYEPGPTDYGFSERLLGWVLIR
ncbi:hypothetical protein F4X73_14875 [Candidatus Poribacteria bacterium]|nr:hypothetical protein [Candidatus Poribacteria bacterium]MYF54573.1 hypothetical protein [Candidatus Poribacteria bacterium]